jgi:hypothetical protein
MTFIWQAALVVGVIVSSVVQQGVPRNPQRLEAVQLASSRAVKQQPRVRFVWDRVNGATEYVLIGKWTSSPAWTVHTVEYRVTPRLATDWGTEKIVFDVAVPSGSHSWEVVAVFGAIESADFQRPTVKSFEIR